MHVSLQQLKQFNRHSVANERKILKELNDILIVDTIIYSFIFITIQFQIIF